MNWIEWDWQDKDRTGRPWKEAVIYELHVGTFSSTGDFFGVMTKLEHLRGLGITAIQLMPIAEFPGQHNGGYDGTLPFAPARCYGTPDDLKLLVHTAHSKGLMVFLDVVYNHFGPESNYLHCYVLHMLLCGETQDYYSDYAKAPLRQLGRCLTTALLLLASSTPLLFMGREWGCMQPFCYFCHFAPDLNDKVREGRLLESVGWYLQTPAKAP